MNMSKNKTNRFMPFIMAFCVVIGIIIGLSLIHISLPLFLGMTRYDFQNVAGKTRFDFQKLEAGETIFEEGTSCTRLYYLISGDIKVITQADDYGYQVEDCLLYTSRCV